MQTNLWTKQELQGQREEPLSEFSSEIYDLREFIVAEILLSNVEASANLEEKLTNIAMDVHA